MSIKVLDSVRSTVPLEGPDVFDPARILTLPPGTPGAVIEVWPDGGYEVEFLLGDPAGDYRSVMIPVQPGEVEPAA